MTLEAPIICINDLKREFSTNAVGPLLVLDGLSIDVPMGSVLGVVGPSGCGKTTLLRIICGLLAPSAGSVLLAGAKVTEPSPDVAVVFQNYTKSLLPWRTVEGNIRLGLHSLSPPPKQAADAVVEALRLVGLTQFRGEFPWRLSGGMQQRVALARALIRKPSVLLMDEPFGSLDAQSRYALEDQVLELVRRLHITVVFVTHDIDEAVYMSDSVVVLSARPARILETKAIDLGWPRDQIATRSHPRFGELRGALMRQIRHEEVRHASK